MRLIEARNVNYTLPMAVKLLQKEGVRVAPRGLETLEINCPTVTTYQNPLERVLFEPIRDANPFFHFFEALWILGGREDVAYLDQFNSQLKQYSDDGVKFHAPYGHRLRNCGTDQLDKVVELLKKDPDTRQAVLQIWDFNKDLGTVCKDLPCNDLIFLKIRNGKLNITVCCRSNDMIFGCYGANVVQFSVLQEYLAARIGCKVGVYNQISDSFHVYTGNPLWDKLKGLSSDFMIKRDPYSTGNVEPYALVDEPSSFDEELKLFLNGEYQSGWDNLVFPEVAIPMRNAWYGHKVSKCGWLNLPEIHATDWRLACEQWLARRGDAKP
jgi:hypothetical protein